MPPVHRPPGAASIFLILPRSVTRSRQRAVPVIGYRSGGSAGALLPPRSAIGAGMVIGGIAAAFFLDKPQGTWTKIGIAIAGLLLGWLCYSIASNILTYMHTAPEERH